MRVGVCQDTRGTCVPQITPASGWVSPRCGWCMDHAVQSTRGHIGSIVLGSPLNAAPNLHWVREWSTSSARPPDASEVHGRSVLHQPPAGRIRCYLSDWEHYHQSLPSTSLRPDSNRHRAIHLCMTCGQDKQSSMPRFCLVCLMCERSCDNGFITTCNWFRLFFHITSQSPLLECSYMFSPVDMFQLQADTQRSWLYTHQCSK